MNNAFNGRAVLRCAALATALLTPLCGWSDGVTIAPVEEPYVHALEREIELHSRWQHNPRQRADQLLTTVAGALAGQSNRAIELSMSGLDLPGGQFQADSVELEAKWQLSEQGEFTADWGLAVELEREIDTNRWEAGATLLWQRQLQRWVATLNGSLYYEWGSHYQNEWETSLAAQLRYRLSPALEPTLVLHLSQDTGAVGPGLWLHQRLAPGRRLNWQLALLQGFKTTTPEQSLLLSVEYEFY